MQYMIFQIAGKTDNMFFQKNLKRPTIPAEYGSKVPISVRQRYLNTIIDECLPLYQKEEDAFKRVSLWSNNLHQQIVLWRIEMTFALMILKSSKLVIYPFP